jgi:hypothetical protein
MIYRAAFLEQSVSSHLHFERFAAGLFPREPVPVICLKITVRCCYVFLQVYGQLKAITAKWKSSAHAVMKRHSTFQLTETVLASEHNYGAPRGLLNTEAGQVMSKAVVKYMNRSVRRRQTVQDVDSLLEAAAVAERTTPLSPPPSDRSPGFQRKAPPTRSEAERSAQSSRSNSISPPRGAPPSAGRARGDSADFGDGASPQIRAFARKALAVAAAAMQITPPSPEPISSPNTTLRKLSAYLPIAEWAVESQDSLDPPVPTTAAADVIHSREPASPAHRASSESRAVRAVQGYYNFGGETRSDPLRYQYEDPTLTVDAAAERDVTVVTFPAALVGATEAAKMTVKIKKDQTVGAAFDFKDESPTSGTQALGLAHYSFAGAQSVVRLDTKSRRVSFCVMYNCD